MKRFRPILLSIISFLSTAGTTTVASAQDATSPSPVWSGERTALTSVERVLLYLSVGSVTCHEPATGDQPEQYFHGTGQLTIAKNVVTTAAHNLIDPMTCHPYTSAWTCEFRMENGKSYPINMKESRFGFSMNLSDWSGQKPGHCKTEHSEFVKDDWAVLKLVGTADATPYPVSKIDPSSYIGGTATEIAGYTHTFLKDGKETPTKERCRLEGKSPVGGSSSLPLVLSNCGGGGGTSGSGLYIGGDGTPVTSQLIAIYHGPLIGHGDRKALYVPIAGEFLTQLKAVASKQ